MATFLLLLLLLGSGSVPAVGEPNNCFATKRLHEDEVETIKTVNATNETQLNITAEVDLYPYEGFQGVGLEVVDGKGTHYVAWFSNGTCLQWNNEWKNLKVGVHLQKSPNEDLFFRLKISQCSGWCRKKGNYTSIQRLSVVGYGSSNWRYTPAIASCTTPVILPPEPPYHKACLEPPPFKKRSASLPPSIPSSVTAVVVVGWVVGIVTIVTIVVVTVVVVWQIWRQGSAPSYVISHTPQPGQPPRHSHVSINSLYEPFGNQDNDAATAGHRGFLHVSENSLYEPFTNPDNRQ